MADRMDALLRELAEDIVFPATPPVVADVRRRVDAPTPVFRRRSWPRSMVLALGLTVLAVAAMAAAVTWVLPGLRIVPVASVPPAPVTGLGDDLRLGEEVDPSAATFSVERAGPVASVYTARDGSVTSLVFAPRDGLPEIDDSGIGLLVQRLEGELEAAMVEKLVDEVGASVTPINVGSADGFWIEGPPHLVRYLAATGSVRSEMTRLVGDTLVWQRGDVVYRMESSLGRDASLRLAESVQER